MSTMYIACNNCTERGYFLGDVLTVIKAAWLFVENEPHDHTVLSLHHRDPLNFLWDRFIAENRVTVVHDAWFKDDRDAQYAAFGDRLARREVKGIRFDTYKELYPRLDGGDRQHVLCGAENGLERKNIFGYYYFGQQTWQEEPQGEVDFGLGVIDAPEVSRIARRGVFIAPHEKCQGNEIFTHHFWRQVATGLLDLDIHVTVNDDSGFLADLEGELLTRTFLPFRQLVEQVAAQRLVLAGNNGVGWLTGALEVPLLALERNTCFDEYSFARCGMRSLVEAIGEPDADRVVQATDFWLE